MVVANSKSKARVPSYRSRAGYSHALVTLTDSATGKRRDYWLGPHGSPESREAYHRVLAEWEANGRRFPDARLVDAGPRTARSAMVTDTVPSACLTPDPSLRLGVVRAFERAY
ncbi:MAG: hypothetical protein KF705_06810 [Phycisphaeraceae bacterium]|nr:hypothetical protein [Phycisphaeraceae bacterium]